MQISVVIPTCNRKPQLLNLLQSLNRSAYPLLEVIIIDSGEERLVQADFAVFTNLAILYLSSEKSVCIQRNKGIQQAKGGWIFLCDDDIELPPDYLVKLAAHIQKYPEAGAVSGQWLQKENEGWQASWPETSTLSLLRKYIFQLSIWGEITCAPNNGVIRKLKRYYARKGNHVSRAGWPVITQMSGEYFITPVYTLGASLVKREWLLHSPYDEVLDRYGIGDNYGVAVDFPRQGIHIVNEAYVYHYQEPANRLKKSLQYYRRALAIDYFARTKSRLRHVSRFWILWSLFGNLLNFIWARNGIMIRASLKAMAKIIFNNNPYYKGSQEKKKVVEPLL
jgi:glycosyltransferase involved in cell wall biosynthesis